VFLYSLAHEERFAKRDLMAAVEDERRDNEGRRERMLMAAFRLRTLDRSRTLDRFISTKSIARSHHLGNYQTS